MYWILILQPLVENSIKYAVANREDGGTIRIESHKLNNQLQLLVGDEAE